MLKQQESDVESPEAEISTPSRRKKAEIHSSCSARCLLREMQTRPAMSCFLLCTCNSLAPIIGFSSCIQGGSFLTQALLQLEYAKSWFLAGGEVALDLGTSCDPVPPCLSPWEVTHTSILVLHQHFVSNLCHKDAASGRRTHLPVGSVVYSYQTRLRTTRSLQCVGPAGWDVSWLLGILHWLHICKWGIEAPAGSFYRPAHVPITLDVQDSWNHYSASQAAGEAASGTRAAFELKLHWSED